MADRFEDERGVIQDLLGPVDAVTEIFTRKGAIRGNHIHERTIQWAYVVSGRLMVVTSVYPACTAVTRQEYVAGQMAIDEPGVAHAWKALEDTVVLVFTQGPRSGESYESDVIRLDVPLLS